MCRMAQALFLISFFLFFVTGLQAEVKFPHLRGLVSCVSRAYLTVREAIYVFPVLSPCLKRIWSYEHEPRAPAPGVSIALAPTHHSGCESPLFLIPENFLFLAWVWLSFFCFFLVTFYPAFGVEWVWSTLGQSFTMTVIFLHRRKLTFILSANVTESTRF